MPSNHPKTPVGSGLGARGSGKKPLRQQPRAPSPETSAPSHGPPAARHKVKSWAALARLIRRAEAKGRRVVFTNGCFDLLHLGHVKLLEWARRQGDVLVVGLNSDRSVRVLKGRGRPILPQLERAQVLAALACVDFVTIFDEDTPRQLLVRLRPH